MADNLYSFHDMLDAGGDFLSMERNLEHADMATRVIDALAADLLAEQSNLRSLRRLHNLLLRCLRQSSASPDIP